MEKIGTERVGERNLERVELGDGCVDLIAVDEL